MDCLIIIMAGLCLLAGIAGSLLPILPGPPLSFAGLLLMQLTDPAAFTPKFIWVWLGITIAVSLLDYYIPSYGTKKFGGSRYGIWGTFIGLVAGIFLFPPFGIIIGPLMGAMIGEFIAGKDSKQAIRAAWGSFVGLLAGTLLKLTACLVMTYYYFVTLF